MKEIPKYRIYLKEYSKNDGVNKRVHDTGEIYVNSYIETNNSVKFKVNYLHGFTGEEKEIEFEEPLSNIRRIEEI